MSIDFTLFGGLHPFTHIVAASVAVFIIYFLCYPVVWYFWDPLELKRFPAPSFIAAVTPLWLMRINGSKKRSYRIHEAHRRLGSVIRVGPETIYFNDPRAINDIYGHKAISQLVKDSFYDRLATKYHDIVQVRDRGDHSRKRKYLAHAFALKTVTNMEPVIREKAEKLINAIDAFIDRHSKAMVSSDVDNISDLPSAFNLRQWLNYFTFDVIGDMAFGRSLGFLDAASDAALCDDDYSGKRYTIPHTIGSLHTGILYSITIAQITSSKLHQFLNSTVGYFSFLSTTLGKQDGIHFENLSKYHLRTRLSNGPPQRDSGDFIGKIVEEKDGKARELPFGEMLAEAVVILAAGSDTTAAGLTNTMWFLIKNRTCLETLRKELTTVVPGNHDGVIPYELVRNLPYLRSCIDESLRLRPPITYPLPRVVIDPKGATVAGYHLKQGTIVAVPPYTIHRNEHLYKRPEQYDPDRWHDQQESANLKAYNIPFSTGSRACIGRHIAIVELQILISTLVWRYNMEVDKLQKWIDDEQQDLEVFERFNANPGPLWIQAQRI